MPLQGPLPTNLAALEASELLDAQAYASLLSVEDDSTQPSFVVSMLQLYISDSAELLAEIQGELQGPPDAPLPVDAAMRAVRTLARPACDVSDASRQQDLTTHKLKGSSATMGLPKVAEACCSLRESLVCSLSSEPRREALRKLEGASPAVVAGLLR